MSRDIFPPDQPGDRPVEASDFVNGLTPVEVTFATGEDTKMVELAIALISFMWAITNTTTLKLKIGTVKKEI